MNVDERLTTIFNEIKYEKIYKSLSFSERCRLVSIIKNILMSLEDIGDESRFNGMTAKNVAFYINKRGMNRLKKITDFANSLNEEKMSLSLDTDEKVVAFKEEFKKEWKKRIFG